MMDNHVIAINSIQLTSKINDIDAKLLEISRTFEEMNNLVENSTSFSNDDIGNSIRRNYRNLSAEFPNIINNINLIITELNTCKTNYAKQDMLSSTNLIQNTFNEEVK